MTTEIKCPTCNGSGVVNKKVWEDVRAVPGVHLAILSGTPAQRTIKQFPCPDCNLV
jgi:DnaJ-class molecular chaperone